MGIGGFVGPKCCQGGRIYFFNINWPRSLKPVVSSIGISGAFLSVGGGVVEDNVMDRDSDCASWGLRVVSVGRIDVPLHDMRFLILCGLTKQPMNAPHCLICVHRNSRSGR